MTVKSVTIQIGILALIILGLIFTFSSAFAYWRTVTLVNTVDVVVVRDDVELIVTDLNQRLENRYLVPSGRRLFLGDVEAVELSYEIGISRELINEVNLHIETIDVTIGGETTYAHLVDIEIMNQSREATIDLFNEVVTVTVTIRLIEPIDEAEALTEGLDLDRVNVEDAKAAYQSIKGQDIIFTLTFTLSEKNGNN